MDRELKPASEVQLFDYEIDEAALVESNDDHAFVQAGLDLLKEVTQIVIILASSTRMTPENRSEHWTRDEAVLGGLIVRLMKLLVGFLDGATKRGGEIANYFTRGLLETAVSVRSHSARLPRDVPSLCRSFVPQRQAPAQPDGEEHPRARR